LTKEEWRGMSQNSERQETVSRAEREIQAVASMFSMKGWFPTLFRAAKE